MSDNVISISWQLNSMMSGSGRSVTHCFSSADLHSRTRLHPRQHHHPSSVSSTHTLVYNLIPNCDATASSGGRTTLSDLIKTILPCWYLSFPKWDAIFQLLSLANIVSIVILIVQSRTAPHYFVSPSIRRTSSLQLSLGCLLAWFVFSQLAYTTASHPNIFPKRDCDKRCHWDCNHRLNIIISCHFRLVGLSPLRSGIERSGAVMVVAVIKWQDRFLNWLRSANDAKDEKLSYYVRWSCLISAFRGWWWTPPLVFASPRCVTWLFEIVYIEIGAIWCIISRDLNCSASCKYFGHFFQLS